MAYIYKHIRLDTNEVFYIGIGSDNTYKRANLKKGRSIYWNNIINKSDYRIEILEDNISWEEALLKEVEYIKKYGRKDLGLGSLCNLTDGGEGTVGKVMSEELKSFHRNTLNKHRKTTAEINRKLKTGSKLSKETLLKLQGRKLSSKAKEKISNATSKKIICVEDNIEFNSIIEASTYYKVLPTSITNILTKRSKKLRIGKSFKYK